MGAFQMNSLESVVMPDTVTSLGKGAFASNKTIQAISISKGLTEIPDGAFGCSDAKNYMTELTEIVIPDGITRIGNNAFAGNNFHSIDIPSSVKEIGRFAFSTKNYLSKPCKITLHEGLETIGNYAFRNKVVESVLFPKSVKKMGVDAFRKEYSDSTKAVVTEIVMTTEAQYNDRVNFPENEGYHKFVFIDPSNWNVDDFNIVEGCIYGLSECGINKAMANKALVIPSVDKDKEPITCVSDNAFAGRDFTSVEIPSTVDLIAKNAFRGNKLTSIKLPEALETIGESAFEKNAIESVDFSSVKSDLEINDKAFANNKLVYAELPAGTKSVAEDCFEGNRGVFKVVYLFSKNDLGIKDSKCQKYVVGDASDVHKDWEQADFKWNEDNQSVVGFEPVGEVKRIFNKNLIIPATTPGGKAVQKIEDDAFCVPDSAVTTTKFGQDSPEGLVSAKIPSTVKSIGDRAFRQNALAGIDLKQVTTIGGAAFYGNKIKELRIPDSVTSVGDGAFATNSIDKLTLSKNMTVIPQGCFSMNIRLDHVDLHEGITEIKQTAFAGARLTELKIPSTVTKIGRKAFHLHHLSELVIPGNVKVVDESAFEGTFKATTLKKLVLEEGIEEIGKFAFKEGLLEEVKLPNSLKVLGKEPFRNNAGVNNTNVVTLKTNNKDHLNFAEDDTYKIVYEEAKPGGGESGETPSTPITPSKDPITNNKDNNGNVSTDVNLGDKVTTENGKADVKIDKDLADKVVTNAVNNKSESVDINATTSAGNADKTEVAVPTETFKDIASKTDAKKVTVKTDSATVSMDKETVVAIAEQAGSAEEVKLVVETKETSEDKVVIALKFVTSNGEIHDFKGGKVTVTVPVKNISGKKLVAVYIDDNGKYTKLGGELTADKKAFVFETGHFSTYAVMTEKAADAAIKAQEPTKPVVKSVALTSVKAQKKAMKVTWKKSVNKVNGYQVRYSTSKSFKASKTLSVKYTKKINSKTVKKLKSGKRYYVKVRTYVKNADGTYYSKWSKVKSVKVK